MNDGTSLPFLIAEIAVFGCASGFLFFPAYFTALIAAGRKGGAKDEPPGELPTVSVIIAAKGESRVLPATLEKVRQVDYPKERLEVLVAVHGADVETAEACSQFRDFVRLVVSEEDRGKPHMLGVAEREAEGEFLLLLDADSHIQPDAIRVTLARIAATGGAAATGVPYPSNFSEGLLPLLAAVESVSFARVCRAKERLSLFISLPGFYTLVRRSAVEKVGGWRQEALAEDAELSVALVSAGFRSAFSETVVKAEAPSSVTDFFRQRLRWYRGMVEGVIARRKEIATLGFRIKLDVLATLCVPIGLALLPGVFAGAILLPQYFLPTVGLMAVAESVAAFLSLKGAGVARRVEAAILSFPYLVLNSIVALVSILTILFGVKVAWSRTPKRGEGG